MEGSFVVKAPEGFSSAVAPCMKLEQSIQRPKMGAGDIVAYIKQSAFLTE